MCVWRNPIGLKIINSSIGIHISWSALFCWLMQRERTLSLVTIGRWYYQWSDGCSGDVTRESADAFRTNVIAKKDTGTLPPIHYIDGASFIYVRNADHYIVAVTKKNANPGMESYRPWLCRHDLPLPLPLGQDVQELLRQRVPGCMLPPSMLMCRMIFVTSSPLSMKFSMV